MAYLFVSYPTIGMSAGPAIVGLPKFSPEPWFEPEPPELNLRFSPVLVLVLIGSVLVLLLLRGFELVRTTQSEL